MDGQGQVELWANVRAAADGRSRRGKATRQHRQVENWKKNICKLLKTISKIIIEFFEN
jgi:hypothetical protein